MTPFCAIVGVGTGVVAGVGDVCGVGVVCVSVV